MLPKNFFSGGKLKIIFIPQGVRVYAKENKREKHSAAYGDCRFPNKNSNYIPGEVWNIFGISKSLFFP